MTAYAASDRVPPVVAFPAMSPRWLVALDASRSARQAFSLYTPSGLLGRSATMALAAMCRAGVATPVWRRFGGPLGDEVTRHIAEVWAVAQALDLEVNSCVGWLGSAGPDNKLSLALLSDTSPVAFVKIASTEAARGSVAREAANLEIVGALTPSINAPRVLTLHQGSMASMLFTSPLPGTKLSNRDPWSPLHSKIVLDISGALRDDSPELYYAALSARVDQAASEDPRLQIVPQVLAQILELSPPPLRFAHGDLTPWNCVSDAGRLGVLDWEYAGLRPPAWDLYHYLFQVETHGRRSSIQRSCARIEMTLGRGGTKRAIESFAGSPVREMDCLALYLVETLLALHEGRWAPSKRGKDLRVEMLRRAEVAIRTSHTETRASAPGPLAGGA